MIMVNRRAFLGGTVAAIAAAPLPRCLLDGESVAGWKKHPSNPVIRAEHYGVCFDVAVIRDESHFRMWLSWRPKRSIAYAESADGIFWTPLVTVLEPIGPEIDVNRPTIIKHSGIYHMWFTGQTELRSWISYATSVDGKSWRRMSTDPAMVPLLPWEKVAVMCPEVTWDDASQQFRMWYSGGEQYEPDAIGYATSQDGLAWARNAEPIFVPNPKEDWEKSRVTACSIRNVGDMHYMFYIGFEDVHRASIGIARSRDGITGWVRHPQNPIIRRGSLLAWDRNAVYKPSPVLHNDRWLLWYNGRSRNVEQIGLAYHDGADLGF